jgi:hypothetical protein
MNIINRLDLYSFKIIYLVYICIYLLFIFILNSNVNFRIKRLLSCTSIMMIVLINYFGKMTERFLYNSIFDDLFKY